MSINIGYCYCYFRHGRKWGRLVDVNEFLAVWTGKPDGGDPCIQHWYRCAMCRGVCWGRLFADAPAYPSDEEMRRRGVVLRRSTFLPRFVEELHRKVAAKRWWETRKGAPARESFGCPCHDNGYDGDCEVGGVKDDTRVCRVGNCARVCFGQYLDGDSDSD